MKGKGMRVLAAFEWEKITASQKGGCTRLKTENTYGYQAVCSNKHIDAATTGPGPQ
jgi:hypothetical protein